MMKWLEVFCAVLLFGAVGAVQAADTNENVFVYQVRTRDTLSRVFPREWAPVCNLNKKLGLLTNCNVLRTNQLIAVPFDVLGVDLLSMSLADVKYANAHPNAGKEKRCVNLGATPWNKFDSMELRLQGIKQNPLLTPEEKVEAKAKVQTMAGENIILTSAMNFSTMSSRGKNGQPVYANNVRVCTVEQGGRVEVTKIWKLSTGTVLAEPLSCGNIGTIVLPPPPTAKPQPLAPVVPPAPPALVPVVPPVVVEQPRLPAFQPAPLPPISAFAQTRDAFEWEVIAGAGVWDDNLAHGTWQYGEAMLSAILPDGYRLGIGAFGMHGAGDSKLSAYHWNEKAHGPQIGFKRNFLKSQTDQFGQQVELPAQFGIKLRYLHDGSQGGNPESGYAMAQTGRRVGLYLEYAERQSEDLTVGVNGEIWRYNDGRITSTWSGDKPQDRGSANLNLWGQYRHSDDWQTRGIVGLSHQNWDQLNYFRLSAEVRYKETVMCGPSLALALNKPEAYAQVARHDLTTLGFSCRLELGGVIRTLDREQRKNGVEYVGPVPLTP